MGYLSVGIESILYSFWNKFTKNKIFRAVLLLQLAILLANFFIQFYVIIPNWHDQLERDKQINIQYYTPSYVVALVIIAGMLVLILFEEITKHKIRQLFVQDHQMLSIFFEIRLGMWSPR
mmetsp:Transcript_9959/g.7491  ORF Transcript_9959/g.7491 Transcript_9959/m.7491 type:complete len:120 (+) Transcript_9959:347-706(+)